MAAFQRIMMQFVTKHNLKNVFPYLDNIIIGGHTESDHDEKLESFLTAAKADNLEFNERFIKGTTVLDVMGYRITEGQIKPDPERVKPLLEMDIPTSMKNLKKIIGIFAYYARWIEKYSEKVRPLIQTNTFPLSEEANNAFHTLKNDLSHATLQSIDESATFTVETDTSDFTISATLNQLGRPVAFLSRTLQKNEIHHSAVEKEASAIVEAIRKWRHFLVGKHFCLVTDQEALAFIFNSKNRGKIKNDKLMR